MYILPTCVFPWNWTLDFSISKESSSLRSTSKHDYTSFTAFSLKCFQLLLIRQTHKLTQTVSFWSRIKLKEFPSSRTGRPSLRLFTSHSGVWAGPSGNIREMLENVSTLWVCTESLEFVNCIAAPNINTWWQCNYMKNSMYLLQNWHWHTRTHTERELVETCHVYSHQ